MFQDKCNRDYLQFNRNRNIVILCNRNRECGK